MFQKNKLTLKDICDLKTHHEKIHFKSLISVFIYLFFYDAICEIFFIDVHFRLGPCLLISTII